MIAGVRQVRSHPASSRDVPGGRRYFEPLLFALAIAAVVAAGLVFNPDWTQLLSGRIERVELTGDYRHIDRLEVERMFEPLIGQGWFDADPRALGHKLEAIPWVRRAIVRRAWPGTLRVSLEERAPAAYWGDEALLDVNGEVFAPVAVQGYVLPRIQASAGRGAAALALYRMAEAEMQQAGLSVAALREDQRRSLSLRLADGLRLVFGRSDFDERVQRFVAAYRGNSGLIDGAACIDLRYPNGFAVQMQQQEETSC